MVQTSSVNNTEGLLTMVNHCLKYYYVMKEIGVWNRVKYFSDIRHNIAVPYSRSPNLILV